MALTAFAFELILPLLKGARVLSLGYPDILLPMDVAEKMVGKPLLAAESAYAAAHKFKKVMPETFDVFCAAGARSVRFIDVKPSRGCEEVIDLNDPHDLGEYDLVLDAGTIEHCANIGQALKNAAQAVAPLGHVFHSPPMSMINHGFYNVCPTLLWDFYEQNGWGVKHLSGFNVHGFDSVTVRQTQRFSTPHEVALYFLAQRGQVKAPLHWPTQTKYRSPA